MLNEHAPTPHAPLVVRCWIPRGAADAIGLESLQARAREAGIADALLTCSEPDASTGRIRIVADIRVASFLTDLLRARLIAAQREGESDAGIAIHCADAFGAMLASIDEARILRDPLPDGRATGAWATNLPPRQAEVR